MDEIGEREAAAQPQRFGVLRPDLLQAQAPELVEGDAAGEGLRALAQELGRSASQNQENAPACRQRRSIMDEFHLEIWERLSQFSR